MFKKLYDDARLPERATMYSAGFDVFSNEDAVIGAGETKLIGTGIVLELDYYDLCSKIWGHHSDDLENDIDTSFYFALHIRSSLRAKGLTSLGTGIIDMDYRDEIKIVVHNPVDNNTLLEIYREYAHSNHAYKEIKKGDKIGQLILCRHEGWLLPSEYTKDEERNGGFGSTGS